MLIYVSVVFTIYDSARNKRTFGNRDPMFNLLNDRIRFDNLFIVDEEGAKLGLMSKFAALELAREKGLDLLVVSPNAVPPVARFLSYSKFKYEQNKKKKDSKGKKSELKEMWFKPKIEEADILHKVKKVEEFIKKGDRVKLTVKVKGGRILREDIQNTMARILAYVSEFSSAEGEPKFEGRNMSIFINKKK